MSFYNSEDSRVLERFDDNGNMRMLLMHEKFDGGIEYVIGSYFTEKPAGRKPLFECPNCGDFARGEEIVDYSWDWGHYFNGDDGLLKAVEYWESEVLRKPLARKMVLEEAWKRFGDTPIDDNDRITEPFWLKQWWSYPAGVSRFEIWEAFDDLYAEWGGVHALAYPSEHQ